MVVIGGLRGSFVTKKKSELNRVLWSIWFVLLKVLKTGDLAAHEAGFAWLGNSWKGIVQGYLC